MTGLGGGDRLADALEANLYKLGSAKACVPAEGKCVTGLSMVSEQPAGEQDGNPAVDRLWLPGTDGKVYVLELSGTGSSLAWTVSASEDAGHVTRLATATQRAY